MIAHTTLAFMFATLMEAKPFITEVGAKQILQDPWSIYLASISGQPAIIIITGMGMESAMGATEFIIEHYAANKIFNCGVAGSLTDEFTVGDIINVTDSWVLSTTEFHEEVCHLSTHSHSLKGYTDGILVTVDQPIFDQTQKQKLSDVAQLVDMEGGIVARICGKNNIPCQLIKIISDPATERELLTDNLHDVSGKLAHRVATDIIRLFTQEMTA